jgi:hypothetical protein
MSNKTHNTDNAVNTDKVDSTVVVAEIVANALNGDFSGYTGADVTIKANVRKALNALIHDNIDKMDIVGATAAKAALTGCMGTKAAKVATPVNHTEIVTNRGIALIAAGIGLMRGIYTPNGINPEDVDISVISDIADTLGLPGIEDIMDATDKVTETDIADIATQKVTKSDVRVDIGAHIAKVIEGAEIGTFFSVRRIASTSTEIAPNGCPSDGAVAMRLFPQKGQCTLIGTLPIKPVTTPVRGLIVTDGTN